MQARGFLPEQIEVEDHVEILEEREAGVTQRILGETMSQFGAREKQVSTKSSRHEDHAVL